MAGLLVAGSAEVWSLALLAGITGGATGFFNPAATSLLPAVVPSEQVQRANGLRATAMASGEIGGPLFAGLLVAGAGAGWAVGIDAATFGLSAAFLSRMRRVPRVAHDGASFLTDLREGWREFRSRTWVWAFVVAAGIGNMAWGAWAALGPVVADRQLGGAAAWGTVLAAMGVGGLAGGLLAIRVDPRRPLVVAALAGLGVALPLALLATHASTALLAAAALVGGGALMLGNCVWESTLQRNVPAASLSRVSAYDWFASMAFKPVGLALAGPLAVALSLSAALWLAFAVLVVTSVGLVALPAIRAARYLPELEERYPGARIIPPAGNA
jgi:MFS family permease